MSSKPNSQYSNSNVPAPMMKNSSQSRGISKRQYASTEKRRTNLNTIPMERNQQSQKGSFQDQQQQQQTRAVTQHAQGEQGRSQLNSDLSVMSLKSLNPAVKKRNQLIKSMWQMNKKNAHKEGKEYAPNQHGASRATYTVDESASVMIDGSIQNTEGGANIYSVNMPANQIAIQNQEAMEDEEFDEADEHAMYQQLLQDFMSVTPCNNSAAMIDGEMYRDNQIIKSRSINQRNGQQKQSELAVASWKEEQQEDVLPNSHLHVGKADSGLNFHNNKSQSQTLSLVGKSEVGDYSKPNSYRGGHLTPDPAEQSRDKGGQPQSQQQSRNAKANQPVMIQNNTYINDGQSDQMQLETPACSSPNESQKPKQFSDAFNIQDSTATLADRVLSTAAELYTYCMQEEADKCHSLQEVINNNEKQLDMTNDQKSVIKILDSASSKTEENIKFLQEHFSHFDFMQKEGSGQASLNQKGKSTTSSSQDKLGSLKDQSTQEQVLKVMKYQMIPANMLVFDYMSQGDKFYILLHGKCVCKVPFDKQFIYLNKSEKSLFLQEFKFDVIKITDATSINRQVSSNADNKNLIIEQVFEKLNQQVCPNPYQNLSKNELIHYIDELIYREKYKIIVGHRDKQKSKNDAIMRSFSVAGGSKANNTNASSLLTSLRPSTKNSDVRVEPNERGHQLPTLRGKQLTPDEVQLLKDNKDLKNLLIACDHIITNYHTHKHSSHKNQDRKFYHISIMKTVKTYEPGQSFGELALITNKRRKAKLEVLNDSDAHFAILSKDDYKGAIFKVQNQLLQQKMDLLKKYDLFKQLSNAQLNLISYGMEYITCSRGQVIYREGDPHPDTFYLVQSGQFKCLKRILKNQDEVKPLDKEDRSNSILKIRQNGLMQEYNQSIQKSKTEQHEVCIHSSSDIFGYQELLKDANEVRSQEVVCMTQDAILIKIHKKHLENMMRKVNKHLVTMVANFQELMEKRITNKIQTDVSYKLEKTREKLSPRYDQKRLNQFETLLHPDPNKQIQIELATTTSEDDLKLANNIQTAAHDESQKEKEKRRSNSQQTFQLQVTQVSEIRNREESQRSFSNSPRVNQELRQIKEIPLKQQSYVDQNFPYFKNSMHSSITAPQYRSIKQFESNLEQKVHERHVHPESTLQQKQKLEMQLVQKRFRVKQNLYNPSISTNNQSSWPKQMSSLPMISQSELRASKNNFTDNRTEFKENTLQQTTIIHSKPESVLEKIAINEASDPSKGNQFQNQMLSELQVGIKPNSAAFQKKNKSVCPAFECQTDWSKELTIVESKCHKFMQSNFSTNPATADSGTFRFRNSASQAAGGNKTLDHARNDNDDTFHLLNQSHSTAQLYCKAFNKIQNKIQKSINSEYDFQKDIEELTKTKERIYPILIGDQVDYDAIKDRYKSSVSAKPKPTEAPNNKLLDNQIIQMQVNKNQQKLNYQLKMALKEKNSMQRRKISIYRAHEKSASKLLNPSILGSHKKLKKLPEHQLQSKSVATLTTHKLKPAAEDDPFALKHSIFDKAIQDKQTLSSIQVLDSRPKIVYRQMVFDHSNFTKQTVQQENFLRKSHNSNLADKLIEIQHLEASQPSSFQATNPYGIPDLGDAPPGQDDTLELKGAAYPPDLKEELSSKTKRQSKSQSMHSNMSLNIGRVEVNTNVQKKNQRLMLAKVYQ